MKNDDEAVLEDAPQTQSDGSGKGDDGNNGKKKPPITVASPKKDKPSLADVIGDLSEIQIKASDKALTKRRKLNLSLRKPTSKVFFWVLDNPDYMVDLRCIEVTKDVSIEKDQYVIHPSLCNDPRIIRDSYEARHYVYLTNKYRLGIWDIKLNGMQWSTSALEAAGIAKEQVIRLIPNMDEGSYEIDEAIAEPEAPNWEQYLEGKTMLELLDLGYKDRFITEEDHPVLNDLWLAE